MIERAHPATATQVQGELIGIVYSAVTHLLIPITAIIVTDIDKLKISGRRVEERCIQYLVLTRRFCYPNEGQIELGPTSEVN